jgi:hypothetical protein
MASLVASGVPGRSMADGGWDGGCGWEIEADSEIYHELL